MNTFIVILILIVAFLLAIIVLVQNSKGGGLAANFSAPNQIMGVRRTTDFLEKATWTLAAVMIVLCLASTLTIHTGRTYQAQKSSLNANQVETTLPSASDAMTAPVATPEAE